jgi:hypothetical protein
MTTVVRAVRYLDSVVYGMLEGEWGEDRHEA